MAVFFHLFLRYMILFPISEPDAPPTGSDGIIVPPLGLFFRLFRSHTPKGFPSIPIGPPLSSVV